MDILGIIPMIERTSSPAFCENDETAQVNAASCDDVPCDCDCDCYDCVSN